MTSPAGYVLLPATVDDMPAILDATEDGFSEDPFNAYINHADDPAHQRSWLEKKNITHLKNSRLTGARYMKVVEQSTKYEIRISITANFGKTHRADDLFWQ